MSNHIWLFIHPTRNQNISRKREPRCQWRNRQVNLVIFRAAGCRPVPSDFECRQGRRSSSLLAKSFPNTELSQGIPSQLYKTSLKMTQNCGNILARILFSSSKHKKSEDYFEVKTGNFVLNFLDQLPKYHRMFFYRYDFHSWTPRCPCWCCFDEGPIIFGTVRFERENFQLVLRNNLF